ncbi:MAG: InlB B-repeat-containing protein, partial [Firmicutes bacterium]|nr:InlB B-repeat-containing protein [Bacillota bacterium]
MKSFLKCLALILCFTFALALLPADVSAADKPVGGVTAVADKVEWNSTYSAYAPKFTSIQAVDTEGNPVSYDATSTCLYQEYKNGSLANKVTGLKYDTTYYSAIYIENPDGKKNISHSLVNISIPGYKVMYWDSSLQDGGATVRIVYRAVRIGVYMGGVAIANGYYLAAGSDQATSVRPADHYAYLKDGVLTLHNYTHNVTASNGSDVGILSFMDLTVKVEGTNTITTDGVGINSQEGDLRIEGTVNDSLTINSGSRAIYVYGDLVLDHKGTLNINSGNHAIDCLGPGNEVKIQSGNINIIGYLNCIWLGNHDLTVSGGKVEMLSTAPNSSCIYIAASTVCVNINGGELYLTCEDDVIFNGKFFVTGGKVLMRSCDEESGTVLYCTSVDIASSLTVKASTEPYGTLSAYDPAKNDSYKLVTIGNPADKVYSYKITYDADGGTGDLAPQTVRFGESVTLPENPYEAPANKKFFGWMFMEGSSYDLYDVGEVLTPKKDMTFKAYWAEKISEVNIFVKNPVVGMLCGDAYVYPPLGANYDVGIDYWYMVKDGTYPHPSPADPFEKGDYRLRMKIVPNLGYYFDDSTVFTVNGKSTTNYSPHPNTFVAYREMKFNVDETAIYNVHFDANGGTVTPTFTATKANGKVESLPTPTHSDDKKEFVGWFDAKTGGKKVTTDTVFTDDTLIYAQWKDKAPVPTTFTVTFDGNGGSGTMADVPDINGEDTLPACAFTAPAGKEFKAWSVDGTEKAAGDKITVTENITITAVWKDKEVIPTTYTVTFDGNGGSGTMAAVTDVSGEYTLPACAFTAPAGKEFKAWNVNGTEKAAGDKINVTENITITAVWKDKEVVPT